MHHAFLLLGSNQGNKKALLEQAISLISSDCVKIVTKSSYFFSKSWGYDDDDYVNQAIEIKTFVSPVMLLDSTQAIERKLGRTKKTTDHYEARLIDIDILFFDEVIIETPRLTIPHPRLHLRNFALQPMLEIAPNLVHPVLQKTIRELAENSEDTGKFWQ